jgi:hypothetical protein
MNPIDKNIFRLIDLLIFEKKIDSIREFCIEIGMLEQTISKIKKGINHFTIAQVETIGKKYNVNLNWVFELEDNVFRTKDSIRISNI